MVSASRLLLAGTNTLATRYRVGVAHLLRMRPG
jgi:hypothetical protein